MGLGQPQRTDLVVLRSVIRNGMTHDLAQSLPADLRGVLVRLSRQQESTRTRAPTPPSPTTVGLSVKSSARRWPLPHERSGIALRACCVHAGLPQSRWER